MRSACERVVGPFGQPEGLAWRNGALFVADAKESRIVRHGNDGARDVIEATNNGNGLAFDVRGRLLCCEGGAWSGAGRCVARYDAAGSRVVLCASYRGKPLNEPNDLAIDDRGRVWFTDPCFGDAAKKRLLHEGVYRLDEGADGSFAITRVVSELLAPDGIAVSGDGRRLFVSEAPQPRYAPNRLHAYDLDEQGDVSAHRVLVDYGAKRGVAALKLWGERLVTVGGSGDDARLTVLTIDGAAIAEHGLPAEPLGCCLDGSGAAYVSCRDGFVYRVSLDARAS